MKKDETRRKLALSPLSNIQWKESLDKIGVQYIENFTMEDSLFVFNFYFPERNIGVYLETFNESLDFFSQKQISSITQVNAVFLPGKIHQNSCIFDSKKEFFLAIDERN